MNLGKEIYEELSLNTFKELQNNLNNKILIVKFGATWCKPCKTIKNTCEQWFGEMPNNVICVDIDIDECLDLYMALKTKKMVKGVPAILAYYGDVKRDQWYIPDDSVSGGDIENVNKFFERCLSKANTLA
jgi:thiol-disulfide isomerase/thioredoxin